MGYAITARYVGPTNYRGSRVIATGPALTHDGPPIRATVEWDYGAGNPDGVGMASGRTPYAGWGDHDANYRRAADAVLAKLRAAGWAVSLAPDDRGATLPDERTTVYVLRYRSDAEGDADDPEAVIAQALVGPTSAAEARRLAPSTLANLTRAGYRLTRL